MFDLNRMRPVWAEIDLDSLAHNMREIRRLTHPNARVMAVIKADGYGHGAKIIAQTLLDNGADLLAVAVLDEAVELRKAGFDVPLLVLGYTSPQQYAEVVRYDIKQTVYALTSAQALSAEALRQKKHAKIHIKIDSGMGRIGYAPNEEAANEIVQISKLPGIDIEGIFTHFAIADDLDKNYTGEQYERFSSFCAELDRLGVHIPLRHCANSAAIIDLNGMHMDMVRAGIILYGLAPSQEVRLDTIDLKQVMSLRARISHVKTIDAGQSVSYGRKFIADKPTAIATLPIGYADGYTRMLTGKAYALVHGVRARVVGRICMDQCMLDVTGLDVSVGDEAVLFGRQGEGFISIDELAEALGTINYEIVCMINKRVPRVYRKDGEIVAVLNYLNTTEG